MAIDIKRRTFIKGSAIACAAAGVTALMPEKLPSLTRVTG
jgi:hypothetical protein